MELRREKFDLERMMGLKIMKFALIPCAIFSSTLYGEDLEPRAYANTPVGLNFLILGYGYTNGGVATDSALPIQNAHVEVHSAFLAYARSFGIFGKSAKFDVVLPYAWASGNATVVGDFRERIISGLADPRFRFSVNFLGAPALTMEEFKDYQQDTIVGFKLDVTVPGGQYDADKLLNIGSNRWSVKPEIGISKRLGQWTLELAGGIRFYTDNEDFLGSTVREQKPIYSLQSHLIYSFSHGIWAAVDGTYYYGGRTTVDGIEGSDLQNNVRLGVTLALPVNRYNSLKFYYSAGVLTRAGSNFHAVGIAWQYRFGE